MSFMRKELSVFLKIFLQLHNGDNFINQNGETNIFIKSFHDLCQLHRGKNHLCQMYMGGKKKPNPQVQLFQRLTHLLACRADTRQSSLTSAFWPFSSPNPLILLVYKYSPVSLILFSQMSMLSLLLEILQ